MVAAYNVVYHRLKYMQHYRVVQRSVQDSVYTARL